MTSIIIINWRWEGFENSSLWGERWPFYKDNSDTRLFCDEDKKIFITKIYDANSLKKRVDSIINENADSSLLLFSHHHTEEDDTENINVSVETDEYLNIGNLKSYNFRSGALCKNDEIYIMIIGEEHDCRQVRINMFSRVWDYFWLLSPNKRKEEREKYYNEIEELCKSKNVAVVVHIPGMGTLELSKEILITRSKYKAIDFIVWIPEEYQIGEDSKKVFNELQIKKDSIYNCNYEKLSDRINKEYKAGNNIELLRYIEAYWLYNSSLKYLSHGSKFDINNGLLAPMRIIFMLKKNERNNLDFDSESLEGMEYHFKDEESISALIAKIENNYNTSFWYKSLKENWDIVKIHGFEWIIAKKSGKGKEYNLDPKNAKKVVSACSNIMEILTDIRKTAKADIGDNMEYGKSLSTDSIIKKKDGDKYKILVVDDYASVWKPIIKLSMENVKIDNDRINYSVDFSIDGDNIYRKGEKKCLDYYLAEYDFILLDVFITSKHTGLTILEKIRKRIIHVPVVLWTVGSDAKIPAQASLASGLLFKKELTIDQLTEVLVSALSLGKTRRNVSLLNPFFDYSIRNSKLRKISLDFSIYFLKLMDGFHALDTDYLHFFNDHGGRHLVGLLSILERIIRPLLFINHGPLGNDKEYEKTVFLLYTAALCHELGMYPMKMDEVYNNSISTPQNKNAEYKNAIRRISRKLHAPRGMIRIINWKDDKDDDFKNLIEAINNIDSDLVYQLAAIVGYHSRLLILDKDNFLSNEKSGRKIDKSRAINIDMPNESLYNDFNDKVKDCFEKISRHCKNRLLLMKICAIFRIADSLDIDFTRNPMLEILFDKRRKAHDNMENTKREVVKEVKIEEGKISIVFRTQKPSEDCLEFIDQKNIKDSMIRFVDNFPNISDIDISESKDNVIQQLLYKYKGYNNADDLWNDEEKNQIAQLSSLSVLIDIVDEFSALNDSSMEDINKFIRLDEPVWKESTETIKTL